MSYKSVMEMAGNQSLIARVAACAASCGVDTAVTWAQANIWKICGTEGWATTWESATATYDPNMNPDTGLRNDVITDDMIYNAVQPILVASGLLVQGE